MSAQANAQEFLNFYLRGGDLGALTGAFEGIARRQPAVVGAPPEYEAVPADLGEFDSLRIPPARIPDGLTQDFDASKAFMLDVCAAERAVVLSKGADLEVVLLWARDYPAPEFPLVAAAQPEGRIFPADVGQPAELVLAECINRLWEFMAEELRDVAIESRTVECSFEDLDKIEEKVKTGEL